MSNIVYPFVIAASDEFDTPDTDLSLTFSEGDAPKHVTLEYKLILIFFVIL